MKTIILIFLFAGYILAQSVSVVTTNPDSIKDAVSWEVAEISVLQAQLDTSREYSERLNNTVYWSLGVLVTIAILLIGYNWFANFRIYERDKNALLQQLNNSIEARLQQIKNTLDTDFLTKYEKMSESNADAAKLHSESVTHTISKSVGKFERQILMLRFQSSNAEARYWELKGVNANVLTQYKQMLKLAIELNAEHEISYSLEGLSDMLKKGVTIHWAYIPELNHMLDSLPAIFLAQVETIKKLTWNNEDEK